MSWNDMNNGRLGIGGNKNSPDYQEGTAVAERAREKERAASAAASYRSPVPDSGTWNPARQEWSEERSGSGRGGSGSRFIQPETLQTSAKSGAIAFALICVAYLLVQGGQTFAAVAVWTGMAAIAGGIAGALFYIALKLLAVALKIGGVLLVIAAGLHFLGLVNLNPWINQLVGYF